MRRAHSRCKSPRYFSLVAGYSTNPQPLRSMALSADQRQTGEFPLLPGPHPENPELPDLPRIGQSASEDRSTYPFFRPSSHPKKDSIIPSVFCQKYFDLFADSRSRLASLKGASSVEASLASPGSTFSRYLSAFLTAKCATCMSNPKNFTLFVCFGSWLYLRIHWIMSSISPVFQVQKYKPSSASTASLVPFNT